MGVGSGTVGRPPGRPVGILRASGRDVFFWGVFWGGFWEGFWEGFGRVLGGFRGLVFGGFLGVFWERFWDWFRDRRGRGLQGFSGLVSGRISSGRRATVPYTSTYC